MNKNIEDILLEHLKATRADMAEVKVVLSGIMSRLESLDKRMSNGEHRLDLTEESAHNVHVE